MKTYYILLHVVLLIAALGFVLFALKLEGQSCHTFSTTDTSHIRMNTCTGEAHIIVRGPEGFEWQRVNDRP